jgi:8-oxo-dGTP diphosphatase
VPHHQLGRGSVNAAPDEHDALRWFRLGEIAGLTVADPASLPDIMGAINSAIPGR